MPANLPARDLAVIGHADLIGNIRLGQLLLRFSDKRNLRNRVNAVRIALRIAAHRKPEGPSAGDSPLFHRHRSQTWKSNYVTNGKDVFLRGTEIRVYGDSSPIVRRNTRCL